MMSDGVIPGRSEAKEKGIPDQAQPYGSPPLVYGSSGMTRSGFVNPPSTRTEAAPP